MEIAGFTLRSPRRAVHRPSFDVLEARILPTVPPQVYPLGIEQAYPASLVPGSDGDLWVLMKLGDEVDHIAADGAITKIPLGPPGLADYHFSVDELDNGATLGPDGNLWVAGVADVKRVMPNGQVTSFANGDTGNFPSWLEAPSSIVAGPDGALWFAGIRGAIGRITTEGVVTLYPLANPRDDTATSLAFGPDDNLWFTDNTSVGRISMDGTIEYFTSHLGYLFDGITAGPDGNLWIAAENSSFGAIVRMTPAGEMTYFTPPSAFYTQPTDLMVGPDGAIWFVELPGNLLGYKWNSDWLASLPGGLLTRTDSDGRMTEFPLIDVHSPLSNSTWPPVEATFGPDGSLWYSTSLDEPSNPNTNWGGIAEGPREIVRIDASDFVPIDARAVTPSTITSPNFAGPLAVFTPLDPARTSADYASTIDWGDGTYSTGTVASSGPGSFEVDGSHTYQETGTFAVTITLTDLSRPTFPFVLPTVVGDTLTFEVPDVTIPGPGATSDSSTTTVGPIAAIPISVPDQGSGRSTTPEIPPHPVESLIPAVPPTDDLPLLTKAIEPARPSAPTTVAGSGVMSASPSIVLPLTLFETVSLPDSSTASISPQQVSTASASPRAWKPVPTAVPVVGKLGSPRRASKSAPRPPRISKVDLPTRAVDPQVVPVAGIPTPAR